MTQSQATTFDQAVRLAEQQGEQWRARFASLGIGTGYGFVRAAYNTARLAVWSLAGDNGVIPAEELPTLMDIQNTLIASLQGKVQATLKQGREDGAVAAKAQLELYGLTGIDLGIIPDFAEVLDEMGAAVEGLIASQFQAMIALALAGEPVDALVGAGEKVGLLRVGDLLAQLARFLVLIGSMAFAALVDRAAPERFQKMAVAVIDQRTTPCCLGVHGQVQPLKEPFHLDYPPAYAPMIEMPPFHAYCRTTVALVENPEYQRIFQLRQAANAELLFPGRAGGILGA